MSNTKLTPVEWLEETIKQMIYNGGDLGEDEPALMEHIKHAKEMERKAKPTTTMDEEIEDETISSGYGLEEYLAKEAAYTKFITELLKQHDNGK